MFYIVQAILIEQYDIGLFQFFKINLLKSTGLMY